MTTRADSAASPDNGKIQQRSRTRKKSVLFPCSICSRSFNKFEHKERHERTHTSNKPYACSECDRRFNRHDSMLRHVRLNHDSESARLLPGSAPQNPNMGEQQFGVGTDCERSTMVPEPSSTSSPSRQTSDTGQNDAEEVQINRLEFTPLQNMVNNAIANTVSTPSNIHARDSAEPTLPCTPANEMFHSGSSVYPHFAFSDNIAQPANDLAPDPSDADSFNILPVDDINSAFPMGIPSAADEIWNLLSQDLLPDSHSLHASPNFLAELGISADPLFQLRGDSAAEYLQKDNQASPHSELLLDRPDFEGPSLATDGIPPDTQGTFALSMTNTMIKQMSASRPQDVAPLTAETLALCLNIFWTRVWPTYPMIHPSTFSLGTTSAPLLLSMIALGSLSLQNKEIRRQGEYLWKLVNRSIQNNWEQMIESRGPYDPCKGVQLIQTLALSLIYAATSADNSIVNAACISIASGFRWARLAGTLRPENTNRSLILQPGEELDEFGLNNRWRQWASLEDLKRTLTTIYLLDCCLALISDSPSYAKHLSNPVGNIWDDEATYLAKNPNQWRLAIEASRDKVPILSLLPAEHIYQYLVDRDTASDPDLARVPMMNRQTILAGLTALVLEAEQAGSTHSILGSAQLSSIDSALVRFHSIFLNHTTDPRSKSVLIGQWHHTAILLGYTISRRKGLSGSSLWSNPLGRHLLLHANAIRHNSESIHIGRAKVAHLVQIQTLYMAAVVYLDYVAAHHSIKGYSSLNAYSLNQETDWENLNSALGTCICHDNPSTLSVSPHLAAAINFLASDAIPTVSGLPLGSQDIDPLIMVLSGLGQIYPLARDSADKLRISAGSARE